MVSRTRIGKTGLPPVDLLPGQAGDSQGSKLLIAAVLAAGKNGCECDACKLLKRFGTALSDSVLVEEG